MNGKKDTYFHFNMTKLTTDVKQTLNKLISVTFYWLLGFMPVEFQSLHCKALA